MDIKPNFGINIHDWRAMAVLDFLGVAPLHTLSKRAGVQKSQMSRTVSALEQKGFINRETNPEDKRSINLRLSSSNRVASCSMTASIRATR